MTQIRSPVVLVGMPGIGLVGKNAVEEIVKQLALEKVLEFYFHDFPSQALVGEDGMLRIPSGQIHYRHFDTGHDLFVLTGDAQPMNSQGIYELTEDLAKLFMEWCNDYHCFISTGALVPDYVPETVSVHVSGTHLDLVRQFIDLPSGTCQQMTGGFITGANGIIPAWMGVHYDIPSVCLLAETIPIVEIDPRASRKIVQVLAELFPDIFEEFSYASLDEQVAEIEEKLKDIQMKPDGKNGGDSSSVSYFG